MADFSRVLGLGVILSFKDRLSAKVGTAAAKLTALEEAAGRSATRVQKLTTAFKVGAAAMVAGGGILAGLGIGIKTAATFEDIMFNVQRTTGFTDEQIQQLSRELIILSANLPLSAEELGKVSILAGQLGIGVEEGIEGVKALAFNAARMARTSELTEEQATEAFARLAKIFGLSIKESEKIGSALVKMANISTATAGEIVDMSLRFGGLANAMGITMDEAAAFSATMRDAGIMVELGGTAMMRIIATMAEKTEAFAEIVGLSAPKFKELFGKAPAKALQLFFAAFGEMKKEEIIERMEKLGFEGVRVGSVVFGLSKQTEALARNLKESSVAFSQGTVLGELYEKMTRSLDDKLATLWGSIKNLWIIIGMALIPAIKQVVDWGIKFLTFIFHLPKPVLVGATVLTALTGVILFVGGAITTLVATLGILKIGLTQSAIACEWLTIAQYGGLKALVLSLARFTALNIQLAIMKTGMFIVAVATKLWTAAQWLLNVALTANPIGIVIVAIGALVGAIIFLLVKLGLWNKVVTAVWPVLLVLKNIAISLGQALIKFLFLPQQLLIQGFIKLLQMLGLWNKITPGVREVISSLADPFKLFGKIVPNIISGIIECFKHLGKNLTNIYSWIVDNMQILVSGISDAFKGIFNILKTAAKWWFILLVLPVYAVIGVIIKFIKWTGILGLAIKIVGVTLKIFSQEIVNLFKILVLLSTKIGEGIISVFQGLIKTLIPVWKMFVKSVQFAFNEVVALTKTVGKFLYQYGVQPWIEIGKGIVNVFKNVISVVSSVFEKIKDIVMTPIKFVWNTLVDLTKQVPKVLLPQVLQNLKPLAEGAIVVKATPAIIGEAGPEAVLPLTSPRFQEAVEKPVQRKIRELADEGVKIIKFMVTIPVEIDGYQIAKIVREFEEEENIRSFVAPVRLVRGTI
ncbi:MAG: phage tail tape measure protein [Elusimicrobiota bacterium]